MVTQSQIAHLASRALIEVSGEDWRSFLQGLITQDVETLSPGQARFGALLNPQGRLLFDLFVVGPLSVPAFLAVFPKVFRGAHVGHPAVGLSTARSVRLAAPGLVVYADGERVAAGAVDISVVPRALAVLAAPAAHAAVRPGGRAG